VPYSRRALRSITTVDFWSLKTRTYDRVVSRDKKNETGVHLLLFPGVAKNMISGYDALHYSSDLLMGDLI
jgi:hypothetical protein